MEKLPKKEKLEDAPKGIVDKNGRPISVDTTEDTWSGKRPKEKKERKKKEEDKEEDKEEKEDQKGDMEKLKALKSKILELNEKYFSESQREEKALLFSELQKTQQEYRDLEEKLDTTPKMSEEEKKEKEIAESKNLLDLLNKARQSSTEHEDVYWHVFGKGAKTNAPYPKSLVNRPDLLEKFAVGKNGEPYKDTRSASHDLMEFLANEAEAKLKELTKKKEVKPEPGTKEEGGTKTPEGETKPVEPKTPEEPKDPNGIEDTGKLDDLRGDYLKAKRLRGNILRGGIGGFLRRKLNFGGEEMKFGGKKGEQELERVRHAYQLELYKYRSQELRKLESTLGSKTAAERDLAVKSKIIELLGEEQGSIDKRSEQGIELNMFEKMKTWYRNNRGKMAIGGIGLAGAGVLTGGTAIGVGVLGARTALGTAGTYVATEEGLGKYSKLLGDRGRLTARMTGELEHKVAKGLSPGATEYAIKEYIASIPAEEIKEEAARLRMLQVEKGIAIDKLSLTANPFENNAHIASLIMQRDNELMAEEVVKNIDTTNQGLRFAETLSMRLSKEINIRNGLVEKEVDRERLKKMARKTLAALAGGSVGWMIGGKLFNQTEMPPVKGIPVIEPGHVNTPPVPPDALHTVAPGENLWKIITSDLTSHHHMDGLVSGSQDHMIDAFKDIYEKMSPADLKHLGFSSGIVDNLVPGDVLNMSTVRDLGRISSFFSNAKDLSPVQVTQIVENAKEISQWLVSHHSELKGPLNSSIIGEILRGVR
jgi:hypothetical protein